MLSQPKIVHFRVSKQFGMGRGLSLEGEPTGGTGLGDNKTGHVSQSEESIPGEGVTRRVKNHPL